MKETSCTSMQYKGRSLRLPLIACYYTNTFRIANLDDGFLRRHGLFHRQYGTVQAQRFPQSFSFCSDENIILNFKSFYKTKNRKEVMMVKHVSALR